jgi:hypothetical protein
MKRPTKSQIDAALTALRLYDGSFGHCRIEQQQRLYDRYMRAMKLLEVVADAHDQVAAQARKLGPIRPMVGRHI